ncbi:cysteine desulfurase [Halobacillus andaensis]|uniref:Cysteine desulfurase n=1 Tax=Halobacillus andaensis TaxID=1176239 RepID=A0A917EYB1_HALAA|nr:IscS subfamily cysteine desulfurase [Halobacillus andaensis]MBP2005282.1 cysteine desulfurase [Halobacillus andaensis]GGF30283.1 cysteine desulfurase [Halobacillus andaensis]
MKYFDFASTCPMSKESLQTYITASQEYYGNTESLHDAGSKAETLVEHCRATLANLLKVEQEGISFTSGGTESNMLAINALAEAKRGKHIIISAGEHSSIKNVTTKLMNAGFEVSEVPLTNEGIIDMEQLQQLIREDTSLISIQHVNSETGKIQPIEKVHKICKSNHLLLHSDCVQSFGKIDLSSITSLVDSFSISSHKIYGPKGIGALYIRPSLSFRPFLPNVTHESGVRPGTLNTPGIAAFTTAAKEMVMNLHSHQNHTQQLKQELIKHLDEVKQKVEIIGSNSEAPIPIIGLCIENVSGQHMMLEANRKGFYFSTGSACQMSKNAPSQTLLAMGLSEQKAQTFIRISFGRDQTLNDVRGLASAIIDVIEGEDYEPV